MEKHKYQKNHNLPTSRLLAGLWRHISRRHRYQLGALLLVMLMSGLAELVSLGAVLPFLETLIDPDRLWRQPIVQKLAQAFGFKVATELVLPAMLIFASAAVLASFVRLVNLWLNARIAAAIGCELSCEAYRRTLYQPYIAHLSRNSAEVISVTTNQIGATVVALNYLLQLITGTVVAAGLIVGLLIFNAPVALSALTVAGMSYYSLQITFRKELRRNSSLVVNASISQIKALQEGLGEIREVLLNGTQSVYVDAFRKPVVQYRQLEAKNSFLGSFPRYVLELIGLLAIVFFGGIVVWRGGESNSVVPVMGLLAIAAQKLLPALQQIYSGWSALRGFSAPMQGVLEMLEQPMPQIVTDVSPLKMKHDICLEEVRYRYGADQKDVIFNLNLKIKRGERVGIVGTTGSGKSTLVDLVMGLLEPTSGRILVDGKDLKDSRRLLAWKASIAHVPQNVYLSDNSIAENIAFGVPIGEINAECVKRAAAQAQISEYIEGLPGGYKTVVGERGCKLSGGQKQRIAIARALYKQARVIFLDEATSALDVETEKLVISALKNLDKDITIVMITHRLETLSSCDHVVRLLEGEIFSEKFR
jgi:ABC-type bacteriocin/lantibiotic exporter with double-glycine peptidase domain